MEEFRNQNNYSKFNQEQQRQADELKELINEVKDYHNKLISKMQGTLRSKPDFEMLESFQKNVNEKMLNLVVSKIDKDDHKRLQMRLTKKINQLEKEINTKHDPEDDYKSPFLVTNNKYVFKTGF